MSEEHGLQKPVLQVERAIVSHGAVRRDHGLKVKVHANRRITDAVKNFAITFAGPALAGQPSVIQVMAPTMLPFQLYLVRGSQALAAVGSDGDDIELEFTLGAKKLSRGRIESLLEAMISAGDQTFLIELQCELIAGGDRLPLALIPTKGSLLRDSLAGKGSPILESGAPQALLRLAEKQRKGSKTYIWARWWMWPIFYTLLCWCLLLSPSTVASHLPSSALSRGFVLSGGENGTAISSVQRHLPPIPDTRSAAFALGQLAAQAQHFHEQEPQHCNILPGTTAANCVEQNKSHVDGIMQQAAVILDRTVTQVSLEDLYNVGEHLSEVEKHRGVIARVTGAFTVINLVWLMSIAGIAISIGPSIIHVLEPFRDILRKCVRWLYNNVIEPIAVRLHTWGIFEVVVWVFSAALVSDATMVFHPSTGVYVALTSGALSLGPFFVYSYSLWALRLKWPNDRKNKNKLLQMVAWWIYFTLVPLAFAFNSRLIAYFATFAVYTALGFGVACRGLCWVIGFRSERAMERIAVTSTLLLALHLLVRENAKLDLPFFSPREGSPLWLTRESPFGQPIAVVGSLTLYLSLLICSSLYYSRRREASNSAWHSEYCFRNLLMAVALGLGMTLGAICGSPGLTNTAVTFCVLFLVEKYTELHLENNWNEWLLVLCLSIFAYQAAFFLHARPEFVVSLFRA